MTDRDRLIELINHNQCYGSPVENGVKSVSNEALAENLIANGVIVPPCKVGDTFYGINETSYDEYCVYGFKWGKLKGDNENILIALTTYDMEFVWGKEAFLTPEEAEKALSEINNNIS